MSATDDLMSRIESEVTAPLSALGLDVEAVELTPAGKRRVLRIAVDKDGGVTMDDVAAATREINQVLDDNDVMGQQPYTLEVTSRGVDRPLTLPRHWRRNADRLVKVTLTDGSSVTGRIGDSDEESVVVEVSGVEKRLALESIERALVQIEFNRPSADPTHDESETEPDDDDEVGDDLDDDMQDHDETEHD
ncbi:ribosome maturation factor RimP [Nocardioides sp.]|uniref:ribosome maturation factor RimP n=1 Tax=Nocardioides sp. TaxID=35761 RepID=UPI002B2735A9|nr:ribosome maturation factor RimP [Nocardioides sp.]